MTHILRLKPPSVFPIPPSPPPKVLEHSYNTTLIRGPNSRGLEEQGVTRNLADRDLILGQQEFGDLLFPDVDLEAISLLWLDMLALKGPTRPPMRTVAVKNNG